MTKRTRIRPVAKLEDLTPEELAMLGHALRMVPDNACLTESGRMLGAESDFAFFREIPAFKSLWEKTAEAVRERDDMAPFRAKYKGTTAA